MNWNVFFFVLFAAPLSILIPLTWVGLMIHLSHYITDLGAIGLGLLPLIVLIALIAGQEAR